MTFSPTPDLSFVLASQSFSVGALPRVQLKDAPDPGIIKPSLKVKIDVELLLPSSLVGTKPRKKREIENNVEVTVPIGGEVRITLKMSKNNPVSSETRGQPEVVVASGVEHQHGSKDHTLQATAGCLRRLLISNKAALALRRVSPSRHASEDSDLSDTTTAFTVFPITAETTASPLSNGLIPTGNPVALLQSIQMTLDWYTPRKKNRTNAESSQSHPTSYPQLEPDEDDILLDDEDESGDELLSDDEEDPVLDGDDDVLDDEYDFVTDRGEPRDGSLTLGPTRDSLSDTPGLSASRIGTPPKIDSSASPVPDWAVEQIGRALRKLLRTHMIRRFPLVFDGSLISYTPSLVLPNALASSLSRFVNTSDRHRTPFASKALTALKQILDDQEDEVVRKVQQLLTLTPVRKKAQAADSEAQKGKKRKRRRNRGATPEADSPAEIYLASLREAVREQTFSPRGGHELRIRWVLQDAIMQIGRDEWASRRAANGKLCAARIPLSEDDAQEVEEVPTSQDHSQRQGCDMLHSMQAGANDDGPDNILDESLDGLKICEDDDLLYDDDDEFLDDAEHTQDHSGYEIDAMSDLGGFALQERTSDHDDLLSGPAKSSSEFDSLSQPHSTQMRSDTVTATLSPFYPSSSSVPREIATGYEVSLAYQEDELLFDDEYELLLSDSQSDDGSCAFPSEIATPPPRADQRSDVFHVSFEAGSWRDKSLRAEASCDGTRSGLPSHAQPQEEDDGILDDNDQAEELDLAR